MAGLACWVELIVIMLVYGQRLVITSMQGDAIM